MNIERPGRQRELIEDIARKLRETEREFKGRAPLKKAVLVGDFMPEDWGDSLLGFEIVYTPTVAVCTLGRVEYKVARFFEDV